MKVNGVL